MRVNHYLLRALLLVSIFSFQFSVFNASAQSGEITGKVTERGGKEGVPFASVAAIQDGSQIIATLTDIDGNFTLKPLTPGKYDVKVTSVGYSPAEKTGVVVSVDNISTANFEIEKGITTKEVEVTAYTIPLLDVGNPAVQKTVTYEDIQAAPSREINAIVSTAAGVQQTDDGATLNIRGSRDDATSYYVDGIKVRQGRTNVATKSAEQITVITGGIPAQYGDATGGIISITTRGPSKEWAGGIEVSSSKIFDPYNNNTVSFDLSGPILSKADSTSKKGKSVVGFFLAGDGTYDGDPSPRALGAYKVKDNILDDVKLHPIVKSLTTPNFFDKRADYFTMDSIDHVKARTNVTSKGLTLNGKIDIRLLSNVDLTLGGSYAYTTDRDYIGIYSLMNYDNNSNTITNTWRGYAKITQRFGGTQEQQSKSASNVKNAYYSIQADYSRNASTTQNADHQDRIWEYGYVGQFTTYSAPFYVTQADTVNGQVHNYKTLIGYLDTEYTYNPGNWLYTTDAAKRGPSPIYSSVTGQQLYTSPLNPYSSAYTSQYYELTQDQRDGFWDNESNVTAAGRGIANGDLSRINLNAYGLWALPGRIQSFYGKTELNQFSIKATGSADIKNHSIMVGMEYEQRIDRSYSVLPKSLWDLANFYGDFNIQNLQGGIANQVVTVGNPYVKAGHVINGNGQYVYVDGRLVKLNPTDELVNFNYNYVPDSVDHHAAKGFYENVRDRLGVPYDQWVDMEHITPDFYQNSVDLFSADQLITNGVVGYYGYDYLGRTTSGTTSLSDYYNKKDATGNYLRQWGPFQPIYVAGYVQDRFNFNDITFNIGLRVDRFDANQKSVKDMYTFYPAYTASQIRSSADRNHLTASKIPGTIADASVVYVNDLRNPTTILGYRNGDTWYDAQGNPTTDLTGSGLIGSTTTTGTIQPYVIDPSFKESNSVDINAFKDYEPQTTFMPRVAFSFPISDEANFKAHYDILTQRPPNSDLLRFDPSTYYFLTHGISFNASNPDLKPEKTTDYEIEFEQRLTRSSAFTISAFYRELHDLVQYTNLTYAYPISYSTYTNIDFGTVKGLTFTYDLRRTGNVRVNAAYTLQFANGTGSSPGSNAGLLAQQGQVNLREAIPLSFDVRHNLVATFDYHYGSGKDYDGPIVGKNSQIFSRAGLNLVFRALSGTPYTRQANITPTQEFTVSSRSTLAGSLNGSRRPWNFRIDAKADKSFFIKRGEHKKKLDMNVYIVMQNVLDMRNVLSVFQATGSPTDDGYLASPQAQNTINNIEPSTQAYRDLYTIAELTNAGYSIPRRTRLGIQLNF